MKKIYELPWLGPRMTPSGTYLVMANPGLGVAASAWFIPVRKEKDETGTNLELVDGAQASGLAAYTVSCNEWINLNPRANISEFPVGTEYVLILLFYPSVLENKDDPNLQPKAVLDALKGRYSASDLALACVDLKPLLVSDAKLCFAFGSCQYPTGMLDKPVGQASYDRLAHRLAQRLTNPGPMQPEFLLLLGDQIYADATSGLLDPKRADDLYELPHRNLFRMEPVRDILRQIPAYMMLDDHEITDNWEPYSPYDTGWRYEQGRKAYWCYQRANNMMLPGTPVGQASIPPSLDCEFAHGSFPFFLTDTRSARSHRDAATLSSPDTLILGAECGATTTVIKSTATASYEKTTSDLTKAIAEGQTTRLECWLLKQCRDMPKFVSSASAMLPRDIAGESDYLYLDGWDGYPQSLERLFGFIATNNIQNVVFLSGDQHQTSVTEATVCIDGEAPVKILSIHCSGLYAPFPFANARQVDMRSKDEFDFMYQGKSGRCISKTCFAGPGDGYGVVSVCQPYVGGPWQLGFTFDGCTGDGHINNFVKLGLDLRRLNFFIDFINFLMDSFWP